MAGAVNLVSSQRLGGHRPSEGWEGAPTIVLLKGHGVNLPSKPSCFYP